VHTQVFMQERKGHFGKMKIQFNEDGSMKLPESRLVALEQEKESVVLRRKQVNTNNPAIAQLLIRFPKNKSPPENFYDYYHERKSKFTISADVHDMTEINEYEYVLEIQGVLPMYKWMEYFILSFIRDYGPKGQGYTVKVKGQWEKYDTNI
jgi:hypothetical protein